MKYTKGTRKIENTTHIGGNLESFIDKKVDLGYLCL